MHDYPDTVGTPTLRCPGNRIDGRRSPPSSRHQPRLSLPACYLMPRCCALRRVRSMTPRHRSPCVYARYRPACPVRSAPPRRGVSTATTSAPWLTCPGRSTACASRCVPQVVLPQSPLLPPHLHRTTPNSRRPLGAAHPAARPAPRCPRHCSERQGRCASGPPVGLGGKPAHPAAHAAPAASFLRQEEGFSLRKKRS
jgi:hypothetical protein